MILLIDNYDSFTYNLYQAVSHFGQEVKIVRNDQITCEEALKLQPTHIILSPGPKTPNEAGICVELIQKAQGNVPLLGVCLGHQAIAMALGGTIIPSRKIVHGKTSKIFHKHEGIFRNIDSPFEATRYHSLAVARETLPESLKITATTEDDEIMGLEHMKWPLFGIQFHPESILTTAGKHLLENFLQF